MNIIKPKENTEKGHCHILLPVFEGPFDLLFYLVHKEKLDIYAIPLGKITQQYLQYLQSMGEMQVELAGEFLVMAASLLCLKSRLLLPQPPQYLSAEEDTFFFGSKEELVQSLLEYKRFKQAAAVLKERKNRRERIYLRSAAHRSYPTENKYPPACPADQEGLKKAWLGLKLKQKNKPVNKTKAVISAPKTHFISILRWVVTSIRQNTFFNSFLDDFGSEGTKEELISVFTLFLELARRGKLSLQQEKAFSRIRILKPFRKRKRR